MCNHLDDIKMTSRGGVDLLPHRSRDIVVGSQTGHGGNIYTIEIGKWYTLELFSLDNWLLNVY